jgi:hypothetical protein
MGLRVCLLILLVFCCASPQGRSSKPPDLEIFIIRDDQHQQWCGYKNRSESRAEAERLKAMVVVGVEYSGVNISTVHVTEGDESGDWNVDDRYSLDKRGMLQSLSRVIDNFSIGITQDEIFRMRNGRAVKERTSSRSRRTGAATKELSGDDLPVVPIVTRVDSFPFWILVRDKLHEIQSQGKACAPNKHTQTTR